MFLLDTNVVSERIAKRPEPAVVNWVTSQQPEDVYISAVSLGEMRFGLERLAAGAKRRQLSVFLDLMEDDLEDRVLPFDRITGLRWATVRRRAELAKRTIPPLDAMLAATAEVHSLTLVTRNTRDFEGWGGPVFNPWPQPS